MGGLLCGPHPYVHVEMVEGKISYHARCACGVDEYHILFYV